MKRKIDKALLDAMSSNPSNWKGLFYFNRRDPRLLVPKLNPSMGWTLNFASPYAYISLGCIFLIAIISEVYF